jgi:hypothetical protein
LLLQNVRLSFGEHLRMYPGKSGLLAPPTQSWRWQFKSLVEDTQPAKNKF